MLHQTSIMAPRLRGLLRPPPLTVHVLDKNTSNTTTTNFTTNHSNNAARLRRMKRLWNRTTSHYRQKFQQQLSSSAVPHAAAARNWIVAERQEEEEEYEEDDRVRTTTATASRKRTVGDNDATAVLPKAMTVTTTKSVRDHYLEQLQTIPNMLTMGRIAMAPCISYWIVTDQASMAGMACIVAGVTDVLDGWIARTWPSQASPLGGYLDPLADKVLINTVSLSLGWSGVLPAPLVTLWMTKDVTLMVGTYLYVRQQKQDKSIWQVMDPGTVPLQVHPTWTSKLNTGLQFATLATALYAGPCPAITTLSWITGTTTVLSVASYLDYGAFRPTKK